MLHGGLKPCRTSTQDPSGCTVLEFDRRFLKSRTSAEQSRALLYESGEPCCLSTMRCPHVSIAHPNSDKGQRYPSLPSVTPF